MEFNLDDDVLFASYPNSFSSLFPDYVVYEDEENNNINTAPLAPISSNLAPSPSTFAPIAPIIAPVTKHKSGLAWWAIILIILAIVLALALLYWLIYSLSKSSTPATTTAVTVNRI